jgi:hypothetical protein
MIFLYLVALLNISLAENALPQKSQWLDRVREYGEKNKYITGFLRPNHYIGQQYHNNTYEGFRFSLSYGVGLQALALDCMSCRHKNITPAELVQCRNEFVKMHTFVTGERPPLQTLPYHLTPVEKLGVRKDVVSWGKDKIGIHVMPGVCKNGGGYKYSVYRWPP